MSWQTRDNELAQHLKRLPDFPMNPESKSKMLTELIRAEQAMGSTEWTRPSLKRVSGMVFTSAAGIALFVAAFFGYGRLGTQHSTKGLSTNASKPSTSGQVRQPVYFGYHVPFRPMLPNTMASGYKLSDSYI
ncbi:hypothetical protein, partial [Alicyclobacillus acidiphilus]|uniref:hypothetical protein n=1 Tax=Alicyclobacillus acidiphilus TaxID=182455 RepID=UPI000A7CF23F